MKTERRQVLTTPRQSRRRAVPSLGAIFLTVTLDLLGFGLVMPFLADEARTTFHSTAFLGTLLSAVYSLMQFLFVPVWGRLSDRIGRRPVLLWSIGATALGMSGLGLGLAYGSSVAWLFAARAFSGVATANLGTASAYIADVTKPEDRARGMGLIGMAFGLGFILGPAMGGLLAKVAVNGRHGPVACFVAAGLSVLNLVWATRGLVESVSPEKRAIAAKTPRSLAPLSLAAARSAFARPGVALAVTVNFIVILSFANLDQTFRFFNKDVFGMTEVETGGVLAFIGLVAAATQGGLVRRLSGRVADALLLRGGVLLQMLAFAGLALAPDFGRWMLFVSGGVLAVGNGLTQPSVAAYVSKRADPAAQGSTLGTNQAASSLGRVFGPAFGGFAYGAIGPRAPYIAAAMGMAVALAVTRALRTADPSSVAPTPATVPRET
jgi:MFS transporter, DHA1 family, tetracycline resistance protein